MKKLPLDSRYPVAPTSRSSRARRSLLVGLAVLLVLSVGCSSSDDTGLPTTTTVDLEEVWADGFCGTHAGLVEALGVTGGAADDLESDSNSRDALSTPLEGLSVAISSYATSAGTPGAPDEPSVDAAVEQLEAFAESALGRVTTLKIEVNGPRGDDPAASAELAAATSALVDELEGELDETTTSILADDDPASMRSLLADAPGCEELTAG